MGGNLPARDFASAKREKSRQSSARQIQPVAATRHLPLWNMVVTPDTVPEFTIPSLCPAKLEGCGREKAGVGSERRHTIPRSTSPLVRANTRYCPFSEEHDFSFTDDLQTHIFPDPTTRAAMSLPHLSKMITPYGFLTLGESPCVCRRESMFFEESVLQEFIRHAKHTPSLTMHGPVKSKKQSFFSFSQVGHVETLASGDTAPLQLRDSCGPSELARPAHLSGPYGVLQKGWKKCLRKAAPWSR